MHFNRRFVLKSLGLGAAGSFMLQPWAMPRLKADPAKKRPKRYYVFAYFSGGWDITQSLDPRDPGQFTDSKSPETKIQLAWDYLPDSLPDGTKVDKGVIQAKGSNLAFGPAMKSFADAGHHDVSCVVRGIAMDTVTHEVGRRYMITGMMPNGLNAKGSSLPTRIVAQQGDITAVPNLVVRVESYNQGLPAYASGLKVSSISDLLQTLRDGPQAPDKELRALLQQYRATRENCDPVRLNDADMLNLIQSAQTKSRFLVESGLSDMFNFTNYKDPEMVKIKQRYNIRSLSSPEAQAAMAFQAIRNNIAQCTTIELASGLDTHGEEWADDHIERLHNGFKALTQLVTDLKNTPHPEAPGDKLIDHTTILCFSEFARTAMLNNRDGRDHSICNASLLIGAGLPHNTVVGASSDKGMGPQAIDPITGQAATAGGTILTPSLIGASVMQAANFDTDELRVDGLPCLMRKS